MRIVGFNLKKLNVEKKKDIIGKLNIGTNLDIKSIEKETVDIAGEVLKISYIFSIKYEPGFGEVVFEGFILLVPDDIKKTLKDWKKKIIEEETRIFIFNFIISKCNIKALQLEEELGLPSHIPLPKIMKQKPTTSPQTNYAG